MGNATKTTRLDGGLGETATGDSGVRRRAVGPTAIFTTRHTDYEFDHGVCVRVTDLETGKPLLRHAALGAVLDGALSNGDAPRRVPRKGDTLVLTTAQKHLLMTSPVLAVKQLAEQPYLR